MISLDPVDPGANAREATANAREATANTLLSSLWDKYLPLMRERLACLDAAREAVDQLELTAEQRELALDAAHKFAGSLGMFGFPQGTDAARSLEHLLLEKDGVDAVLFAALVDELHRALGL